MKRFYSGISPKIKLYIPIVTGIIIAIAAITAVGLICYGSHYLYRKKQIEKDNQEVQVGYQNLARVSNYANAIFAPRR